MRRPGAERGDGGWTWIPPGCRGGEVWEQGREEDRLRLRRQRWALRSKGCGAEEGPAQQPRASREITPFTDGEPGSVTLA